MRRETIINIIILLISIIIVIFLFEFINKFFFSHKPIFANIGKYNQPNSSVIYVTDEFNVTYRFNNYSERNSFESDYKNKIIVFGDSFTFGWGMNDNQTYVYILGEYLDKYKFQVNNVASAGNSIVGYWNNMKSRVELYNPKLVIIGIYAGNDIGPDDNGIKVIDIDKVFKNEQLNNINKWLYKNFKFWYYLLNIIGKIKYYIHKDYYNPCLFISQQEYKNAFSNLASINNYLKEKEIDLLLVIIPPKNNLNYKKSTVEKIIDDFCIPNNVKCINMQDEFKRLKTKNTYKYFYYKVDGHANPQGQKAIADTIYDYLVRNKLIDVINSNN